MTFNENTLYLLIIALLLIFVDLFFFIFSLHTKKNSIEYKIENISKFLSKKKIKKANMLIKEIEEKKIIEKYKADLLYKKIFSSYLSSNENDKNKFFNAFIEYIENNDIKFNIKDRAIENLFIIINEEQKIQLNKFIL